MMFFKRFFAGVLLLGINIYASVSFNYPGTIANDTSVPGIPSTDINEYKQELQSWSNEYQAFFNNSVLTTEEINKYIDKTLFNNSVLSGATIKVADPENLTGAGSTLTIPFMESVYPISDVMRDILFLEEFQKKIFDWKVQEIDVLGQQDKYFSDIYDKAQKIFERYTDYSGESGFVQSLHNPLLNVLFGTGQTSYGNLFISDGYIENFTESMITDFLATSLDETSFINGLSQVETTLKEAKTWKSLGG